MDRGPLTEPPLSVSFIRERFTIGANSGELLRRNRPGDDLGNYNTRFACEAASYRDSHGVLRARITYRGCRRTINAAKAAWVVHYGADAVHRTGTVDRNCLDRSSF
jgi:hypothetical protein